MLTDHESATATSVPRVNPVVTVLVLLISLLPAYGLLYQIASHYGLTTARGTKSPVTSDAAGNDGNHVLRVVAHGGLLHDHRSSNHPTGHRYASAIDRARQIRAYAACDGR